MGRISYHLRGDPVVGWRYWQLGAGPLGHLRSLSQRGVAWNPGEVLVARCADSSGPAHGDGRHDAPEPGCGCGVHATSDLAALRAEVLCLRPGLLVVGQVELWGRVFTEKRPDETALDQRGQFATPRHLDLVVQTAAQPPDDVLEALAAYGVPVAVSTLEDAVGPASRMILEHLAMSAPSPPDGAN